MATAYFPGGNPGITNDVRCDELKVPQKNSARSYGCVPGASSSHSLRICGCPPAILSLLLWTALAMPWKLFAIPGIEFCCMAAVLPDNAALNSCCAVLSMPAREAASISEAV